MRVGYEWYAVDLPAIHFNGTIDGVPADIGEYLAEINSERQLALDMPMRANSATLIRRFGEAS